MQPLVLPGHVAEDGEILTSPKYPHGAGSLLTFTATPPGHPFSDAIYVRTSDGRVKRILGSRDPFDNGQVDMISADADRNTVALRVSTSDASGLNGEVALYRVTLVSPSFDVPVLSPVGLGVLVLALTLGGLWLLLKVKGETRQAARTFR